MQVTFMVELMVSLINELKLKGFEIGRTGVTEDEIEVLTFRNDKSEYNIAISTENEKQGEYLKLTGKVREKWRVTGEFQIEPFLKKLRCGDRMDIECIEDGDHYTVKLTKCLESKFSLEGVDKDVTRGIALDIIGVVVNS